MKQDTDRALDQLEADLREALAYRSTDARKASSLALRAIVTFLHAQPRFTTQNLHRPLYELLEALVDLDEGSVASLLSPAKFANRHPDPTWFRSMRGHAIFAIEQLITRGESAREASEQVAKIWNANTGATRTSGTIKSWYDRRHRLAESDRTSQALMALIAARQEPKLAKHLASQTAPQVLEQLKKCLVAMRPGQ